MRRKAKYSLIIVAVLVVILGVGFGIWKIFFAPKPLKIRDLENMHIVTTRSTEEEEDGWMWVIETVYPEYGDKELGYIGDPSNIYKDRLVVAPQQAALTLIGGAQNPRVQEGDTIDIRYDSGKNLTIYLPTLKGEIHLYPNVNGSTYYNRRLTKLAQKAPSSKERKE